MEAGKATDRPEIALDIESPDYAANWEALTRDLRSRCPMAWSTEHGGHWVATRYEDVVAVAQNAALFTPGKTFDPETGITPGGGAIPPMPIDRLIPSET